MTSLKEDGVTTYTPVYDLLHNLTSNKQGSTSIAAYGYDGDGLRVMKTVDGVPTVYHHDKSGKLLGETDTSGNRIADYVYVNGNMAAKVESAGVSYYHTDPAGTPTAITDSAGALVWRAEYLPFGEEQLLIDTKVNDKMFVGKEKDEETGLYDFGARYLKDKIGMFTSVDPVGAVDSGSGRINEKMLLNPQRLHRYSYALNNPYRYVDPDGRDAIRVEYRGYMVDTGLKFRETPIKLPLGHAAVLAVDSDSGLTKYYEYGRYDKDNFGLVRNKPVPDLVMKNGQPTQQSLENLYEFISENYGQGKPVNATYYDDADFNKVVDFATDRMNDKNRAPYDKWSNNCKTFSKEAVKAGRRKEE